MMIQVIFMHPQSMDKAETMLINAASIICIGKFPVSVIRTNQFNQQQTAETIQPPDEWYTMLIDSNIIPAVFIHSQSHAEIQAEFENLNINEF